jgi:hypothetical protein
MNVIQFIMAHWMEILAALLGILLALIVLIKAIILIALIIPGPQPEAFLQKMVDFIQKGVDFLAKFSKKKEVE